MATTLVPMTNQASSYTIVTQSHPFIHSPIQQQQNSSQTHSPLRQFLKGEPKALGTVQIMTGVLMILFGIVLAVYIYSYTFSVISGIVFWGAFLHISAGALAVSASNKLNSCVVKSALVLNIFSIIAAGISIILMSIDLVIINSRYCYYNSEYTCNILERRDSGIIGVLLVFSLLQFCISIAVLAFTCKATFTNKPTLNIINVVPNPERCATVVSSSAPPPPPTRMGVNMMDAVAMGGPTAENPPILQHTARRLDQITKNN